WVRLENNPTENSSEIVLVAMDVNAQIFAAVWNGSSWGNVATLTTNSLTATQQNFDLAYIWDDTNPHALVVYGDTSAANKWSYSVWYSTATSWSSVVPGFALNGAPASVRWVRLAMNRGITNPNKIGLAMEDVGQVLHADIWDGSTQAW